MIDDDHGINQRLSPRQSYIHFAWFHRIDADVSSAEHGVARSCDIASGGLGFLTTRSMPIGARLFVVLVTPSGRVSAVGTVMHSRETDSGYFRVGVTIDIVPPTDQATWDSMTRRENR